MDTTRTGISREHGEQSVKVKSRAGIQAKPLATCMRCDTLRWRPTDAYGWPWAVVESWSVDWGAYAAPFDTRGDCCEHSGRIRRHTPDESDVRRSRCRRVETHLRALSHPATGCRRDAVSEG